MIDSLRRGLLDTLSVGADDGPTGRPGSAVPAFAERSPRPGACRAPGGGAYGADVSETPGGEIRASDAEREQVAAELGRAVGEGRLTLAEFSDRVGQAHAAVTRAELVPLTADLPAVTAPAATPGRTSWTVSPIGGESRRGSWRVPRRSVGISLIGGANLDFTEAELAAPEVELTRWSLIGGVSAKVPAGVRVEVSGFTLLGGRSVRLPEPPPGAPVVRLRLFSVIGGISVKPR
jgi:DUF1707 SHOCT-like domain